ncbi:GH25 family lysozyme [Lentilactobacillus sp. Marseille-Q4993]|uniref:GH25 family lysozyme n=1 Tax=Lentilactobacillus sp. Marseille-Q4993 TaxID=3039492 RepID=UPI0024BC3004|nr:GH25 family lysozyme [Lentilactobacillus sp. Marseille-Q4993]
MKREDIQPIYSQQRKSRQKTAKILIGFFVLAFLIAGGWLIYHQHQQKLLRMYPVKGVSITQSNGYIDFEELKNDGFSFVYLRASQGAMYSDDSFSSNFQRSQGSQLPIGVYHVFSFSSSVSDQFKNFSREVGYDTGSLPIAVSIQYYGDYNKSTLENDRVRDRIIKFVKLLRRYYKRPIMIWTNSEILGVLNIHVSRKYQVWLTDGRLGRPNADATFMSADDHSPVKMGNQTTLLPETVFNGSKQKWHRYLSANTNN